MNKLKVILTGYSLFLLYKLGLITDPKILSMVGQKNIICKQCPLNNNGWCSSRRAVPVKIYSEELPFIIIGYKKVIGCGCYLWAKYFTDSKCPLSKW